MGSDPGTTGLEESMGGLEKSMSGLDVVVTGGTGALGGAVVSALLNRGATVHIPGFRAADADRFPLATHDRVHIVGGVDLSNEEQARAFFESRPPLWASVNVAGGFMMAPIADTTAAAFRAQLERNTVSCFLSCQGAVERIRARIKSHGPGGRIVNVAAGPGVRPVGGMVAYSAAKSGVVAITLSLAEELAAEAIRVNAIVPGVMDTPANRAAMPDADRSTWSSLDDVAGTVAWLASPANTTASGALLPV